MSSKAAPLFTARHHDEQRFGPDVIDLLGCRDCNTATGFSRVLRPPTRGVVFSRVPSAMDGRQRALAVDGTAQACAQSVAECDF